MTAIANKSSRPAQGIWPSYTSSWDTPSRTHSGLDNSFRPIGHEAAPPPSMPSSPTVSPPLARPQPLAHHPPPKRGARRFLADLFRRRASAPSQHTPYVPPVMRVATDGLFPVRRGFTSSPLSDDDLSDPRVTSSASEYHGRALSRVNATRDISFHRSPVLKPSVPSSRRRSRPASRNVRMTSEFCMSSFDFDTSDKYPRAPLQRADDIRRFDSGRATGADIRRFDSVRTPQRFDSQHMYPSRNEPSAFELHRDLERFDMGRGDKCWQKQNVQCKRCEGRTTTTTAGWRREQMHASNCPRAKRSPMQESRAGMPLKGFAQRHMSWEGGAKLMRKLSRHRPERTEGKRGMENVDLGFMQINAQGVKPIPPWSGDDVMSSVSRGSESNEER